ncbi:MAG: hypothetical protein HY975_00135 [Candidatus Kerfeldbacteria bacterium]|nr:hypothetical protein [Candidatus Kerfeldbacteria bacterium]
MRQNDGMEPQHSEEFEPRYGFGLTTTDVERLRRILARCGNREVTLEDAWGRASELLALAHTMMEVLATASPSDDDTVSSKVVPGDVLTDSRS